jgi:hypothetical protein
LILVDSSAWVEYLRGTGSDVSLRVAELVESLGSAATTEPVTMEMLAGARDNAQERELRGLLFRTVLLPFIAAVDFDGAARVYRSCRRNGITPRSLIDCMIASVAMRHKAAVLAYDTDFSLIAQVVALELDPATRTDG